MEQKLFRSRCVALMLLSAGYGWAGGHFIPADSPPVAYGFQVLVIGFLVVTSTMVLTPAREDVIRTRSRSRAIVALNVFSVLSFLINVANVVHGAYAHDPSSFGSHNSFADLVPIVLLLAGSGLWAATAVSMRRRAPIGADP